MVGVPVTPTPVFPSTSSLAVVSRLWGVVVVVSCHIIKDHTVIAAVTHVTGMPGGCRVTVMSPVPTPDITRPRDPASTRHTRTKH